MIIHDIEQNTPEWFALRAGIPTASEFNRLITPTGKKSSQLEDFAYELAASKYMEADVNEFYGNQYTERGHNLEDEAAALYSFLFGVDCEKVGFITDDNGQVGCSPDGLVGDDGLIEIKCLGPKKHVSVLMADKKGMALKDFYIQLQAQLFVSERAWVDNFFYHPDLPSFRIRTEVDIEIQKLIKEQVSLVIKLRDDALKVLEKMA